MCWLVRTSKDLGGRPPLASRCISLSWLFFHGGNAGSNPAGDANSFGPLTWLATFCASCGCLCRGETERQIPPKIDLQRLRERPRVLNEESRQLPLPRLCRWIFKRFGSAAWRSHADSPPGTLWLWLRIIAFIAIAAATNAAEAAFATTTAMAFSIIP